ncbi:MAG: DNA replication/repair protein RecF [Alphaproteobacteria bacterium]|nr:DNA replication/repair protein RecF [Alphaproteobacteria bacterium]
MSAVACFNSDFDEAKVRSAVKRLTLVNFRNYKYLRLNLDKPFIILSGENGSGKTNILEAISFLSQGRGLRGAKLSEIKTFDFLASSLPAPTFINNNGWAVSAEIEKLDETFSIGTAVESVVKEVSFNETKEVERRIVQVNNQKLPSQNELGNYLTLIWITPQMDRLFLGGAQHRRSFLDRIVYAFDVEHAKRLTSFDNLYRQWLQILKSGNINNNWLLSIEEQIAGLGVAIAAARLEQTEKLNAFMEKNPDDMFPDAILELDGTIEQMLNEKPAVYVEDFYRESLFNQRRSVLYNDTGAGINKTDLKAVYKKKNVPANLCSTGEQKALLLSIMLSEARCLSLNRGVPPILLLDEIAAHLDDFKRDALLFKINELQTQSFLTTTNLFEFMNIKESAQFFEIKDNQVREVPVFG